MRKKWSRIVLLSALTIALPAVNAIAAAGTDSPAPEQLKNEKDRAGAVNPPTAAEPMKPATANQPAKPVAPGTLDAPPKPVAPGTADKNIKNPDEEIRRTGKPEPR